MNPQPQPSAPSVPAVVREVPPPAPSNPFDLTATPNFWSSLDVTDRRNAGVIMRALQSSDFSAEELRDRSFRLANVIVHGVEVADTEKGELIEATRLVLLDVDGKTVSFVSDGALRGVKMLIGLFGRPPWAEGIPIRVKEVKTRLGHRTYNIVVEEDIPAAGVKKAK